MILTDRWETLAEVQTRTGKRAEEVVEEVRVAFARRQAQSRMGYRDGVPVCEISLENRPVEIKGGN